MDPNDSAAFGIFSSGTNAEAAVDHLIMAGFSSQVVSILLSDKCDSREFATAQDNQAQGVAGAAAGLGGLFGGTLGRLAGIGALAIAGVGSYIVAGPIMATIAGMGVGGALGGLVGALVGVGIPEFEAKQYEGQIKDGGVLLVVHCKGSEEISKARGVLEVAGAADIASCVGELISSSGLDEVRAA